MKLKHALFYLHKPLLNVVGTSPASYGPHRFNAVFTTAQRLGNAVCLKGKWQATAENDSIIQLSLHVLRCRFLKYNIFICPNRSDIKGYAFCVFSAIMKSSIFWDVTQRILVFSYNSEITQTVIISLNSISLLASIIKALCLVLWTQQDLDKFQASKGSVLWNT